VFGLFWFDGPDQSQAVADPVDMGIDRNCRKTKSLGKYDIGDLWSDTG